MLDHMANGRFILGISPGGLLSDAEVFGNLDADRTAMFVEAIDHILAIWSGSPPYDLAGRFWTISTARTLIPELGQGTIAKPYQQPHPPIVVTAVAPFSKGVTAAAARGFDPISANFLQPKWVKTHWPNYVQGCRQAGREADPKNWRVAKSIFVADDAATARRYATDPAGPYFFYYHSLFTKLERGGRANLFKTDPAQPDSSLTRGNNRRPARDPWHPRRGHRPDPPVSRRSGGLRHPPLRRPRLAGRKARPPLPGADGRTGHARGQQGDRAARSGGVRHTRPCVAAAERAFNESVDFSSSLRR